MSAPKTIDILLARIAQRASQAGRVILSSVSGRSDRWHATFDPGLRLHKIEAGGHTPAEALLALESVMDERRIR